MSFTRYVGDGGIEGVRTVKNGGTILVCKKFFQHSRLIPLIGEKIFFWDSADGDLQIYQAKYPLYSSIRKKKATSICRKINLHHIIEYH